MANKNFLFSFDDLSNKDKAVKALSREFSKLNASVETTDIPTTVRRKAGYSYRTVNLGFADGQMVTFFVKKTGDIFEVRLNGRLTPIQNQDDQHKALKEIVDAMEKGRKAFQTKLAKAKIEAPKSANTSTVTVAKKQTDRIQALKDAIAALREQIDKVKGDTVALLKEIESMQAQMA